MDAKTQYQLAFRYHRFMHLFTITEADDHYPVGFDCKKKHECGSKSWDYRCPCMEDYEANEENHKWWGAHAENIQRDVDPKFIEATRQAWADGLSLYDSFGKKREPLNREVEYVASIRKMQPNRDLKPIYEATRKMRMVGL